MRTIVKVVSQTPVATVTKQDGTTLEKCTIVLQELGGLYEDTFVVTAMGPLARIPYAKGTTMAVALRFMTHEFNNTFYQDVMLQDCVVMK